MSYKLVKDHTHVNFNWGNTGRDYIVIHYTGNKTDTAAGNANYFRNECRNASAHYFVDDSTVYEVVAPDNTAWAVGVDYGGRLFGVCNNSNSISIEMCSVDGKISEQTFDNTIELTKKLMKKYGISANHVVRHYDVCNKLCPGWNGWVGSNAVIWDKFKSLLKTEKVKFKKDAGLYPRAYKDVVGRTSVKSVIATKGITAKWIEDDGYGWSKVEVEGKTYYCVNSRLDKKGLSTYRKTKLVAPIEVFEVVRGDLDISKVIKAGKTVTEICYIEKGSYAGYTVISYKGKEYYTSDKF